jgi:hypothetical protein
MQEPKESQDRFEQFHNLLEESKGKEWLFKIPGDPKIKPKIKIVKPYYYGSEIPPGPWLANWEFIVPIALTIM